MEDNVYQRDITINGSDDDDDDENNDDNYDESSEI
jgi:hypothetical protein